MRQCEYLCLCSWRSDSFSYHLCLRIFDFSLLFFSSIFVLLVCTLFLYLDFLMPFSFMLLLLLLILLGRDSSLLMIPSGVPLFPWGGFQRVMALLFVSLRMSLSLPSLIRIL